MLMAIAEHSVIGNVHHGGHLPPSWTTLYELTKLDNETLLAMRSARAGSRYPSPRQAASNAKDPYREGPTRCRSPPDQHVAQEAEHRHVRSSGLGRHQVSREEAHHGDFRGPGLAHLRDAQVTPSTRLVGWCKSRAGRRGSARPQLRIRGRIVRPWGCGTGS